MALEPLSLLLGKEQLSLQSARLAPFVPSCALQAQLLLVTACCHEHLAVHRIQDQPHVECGDPLRRPPEGTQESGLSVASSGHRALPSLPGSATFLLSAGTLYTINTEESTIALKSVRSFGTEGPQRKQQGCLPGSECHGTCMARRGRAMPSIGTVSAVVEVIVLPINGAG